MSDSALVDYYADTLILEYVTKPKARATIEAFVNALIIFDLITEVRDGYNLNTAVGVQLDVLGKYAGVGRNITGFDGTIEYFGFLLYSETPPKSGIGGYSTYGETGVITRFRRYIDNNSTVFSMTDAQYKVVIQLKIFKNYSNASLESIDFILQTFFGADYLLSDPGTMVLSYVFKSSDAIIISIAQFVGLIPAPTGVGTSVITVPDFDHIFGFKFYSVSPPSTTVGFKLYGVAKAGGMAAYG